MDKLADHLTCPITGTYFVDPVVTVDGHAYERRAIEHWLRRKHTSPVTNTPLLSKRVVPSLTIRQTVHILMHASPHLDDKTKGDWHVQCGRLKYKGVLPGGDDVAKQHFQRALALGHADARVYLDALSLVARADTLQVDILEFLRPRTYAMCVLPADQTA